MDSYAYTSLDAPYWAPSQKDSREYQEKMLKFKLQSSNDFTISFSLEELNEFCHLWGFEHALDVVKDSKLKSLYKKADFEKRALTVLYAFVRNHSDKHDNDLETLVEYLLEIS